MIKDIETQPTFKHAYGVWKRNSTQEGNLPVASKIGCFDFTILRVFVRLSITMVSIIPIV